MGLPPERAAIVPDFFVFGAERSGTTLLAFLLSGQPDTFVVNDSFVYDRLAEWSLLGPGAPGARGPRLAAALGADLARSLAFGRGTLRQRYYAARERHLERWRPETPLSAEQAREYLTVLAERYRASLSEGRESFLNAYAEALPSEPGPTTVAGLVSDVLSRLAEVHGGAGRRAIGEKTPLHTLYADGLLRSHPLAKAVLLVREPAASVASMQRRYGDLERVLRVYADYAARFLALREHERVLVVRHEDVAAEPATQVERVLRFLDPELAFDPACPVNAYTKEAYTGTAVDAARARGGGATLSPAEAERVRRRFRAVYETFYA